MAGLTIKRHVSPVLASNMYVVSDGARAFVVDPFPLPGALEGLELDFILLTHEHYDHISGVDYWRDATGARVITSRRCALGCCDPKRNLSRYSRTIAEMVRWAPGGIRAADEFSCEVEGAFEDELSLEWRGHALRMFECPGHSSGSCAILVDGRILFSGDSLFADMPTELGFPGGSRSAWERIGKPRLRELDPGTMVHPGHLEAFALGDYRFW